MVSERLSDAAEDAKGKAGARAAGVTVTAMLAQLGAEQRRLRDLLAGQDEALLAERPPSGKWSVLENVRHLLFAEQAHLGRFGQEWSSLGFTPQTMLHAKKLHTDGTAPTVAAVMAAWEAVHATTRAALAEQDTDEVRHRVVRHLKHQRRHITVIERLLRQQPRR
jgi:DNA-binding GntR family transcriptional regulator